MTAQVGEKLLYKGEIYSMATEPLNSYSKDIEKLEFEVQSTCCWRGYRGSWEIRDGKLFLIDLRPFMKGTKEFGIDTLFPGKEEVLADWFSGEIRIPLGEMLEYVHMGYLSTYEKDLILKFKEGILIEEIEIDNREAFRRREIIEQESVKTNKSFFAKLFG